MIATRRSFLRNLAGFTGLLMTTPNYGLRVNNLSDSPGSKIKIKKVASDFEREPLIRPFGFKGGYMREIWQTASMLESDSGIRKIGLCSQSVLWSDSSIFSNYSEAGGNAMMYSMTEFALKLLKKTEFSNPIQLLEDILEEVYDYGKTISNNPDLRKTFALNALVSVDLAAWLLFAESNGIRNFDDMIPEDYRSVLSYHHDKIASIPLMAYNIPLEEIRHAANEGYFFMKIKIGQPGTQNEMLTKDMERISSIHKVLGNYETPHTQSGKIPYYFDANGRYEKKETLLRLLDHLEKIGAMEQVAIIEEPFPEEKEILVNDLGVRLAADESAHTDVDTLKRIQMGYKAIALKAIAKTLSMTLKIAKVAAQHQVPCFCADLTVNPILVEWNKNVAARLAPFPGLGLGLLETNGHQNYRNWQQMLSYHPCPDAIWSKTADGIFNLNHDFYDQSGGIFNISPHYSAMFEHI